MFGASGWLASWAATGSFLDRTNIVVAAVAGGAIGIAALASSAVVVWFQVLVSIYVLVLASVLRLLSAGSFASTLGSGAQAAGSAFIAVFSGSVAIYKAICDFCASSGELFAIGYVKLNHPFSEAVFGTLGISPSKDVVGRGVFLFFSFGAFGLGMVGLLVWPTTVVPKQVEAMLLIDKVHCNSIPLLNTIFLSYMDIRAFVVYFSGTISLVGAYIFDTIPIFWDFIKTFVGPFIFIAVKLISGDPAYLTCSSTYPCDLVRGDHSPLPWVFGLRVPKTRVIARRDGHRVRRGACALVRGAQRLVGRVVGLRVPTERKGPSGARRAL